MMKLYLSAQCNYCDLLEIALKRRPRPSVSIYRVKELFGTHRNSFSDYRVYEQDWSPSTHPDINLPGTPILYDANRNVFEYGYTGIVRALDLQRILIAHRTGDEYDAG